MEPCTRRPLWAWREDKQLTPEHVAQAVDGMSPQVIRQWEAVGEPPPEALPHLIAVARALAIPLERLDLGPNRRGLQEGEYTFILFARGHDNRQWQARWHARIGAWGAPTTAVTPQAIAERVTSGVPAKGPTVEAALNALEAELRALVRAAAPAAEEAPLAAHQRGLAATRVSPRVGD
jgi:hypothetical protein